MDTGLDAVKIAFKNVVHEADEFIGNKIADAITKSNYNEIVKPNENPRNVEEIIVLLHKKSNIKQIKTSFIIKMEQYEISKLLKDSTVSSFPTKKWIEVNDLSSSQYSVNKNIRFKISMLRSVIFSYSFERNNKC